MDRTDKAPAQPVAMTIDTLMTLADEYAGASAGAVTATSPKDADTTAERDALRAALSAALSAQAAPNVPETAVQQRPHFEWWYTTRGVYEPIGSRECAVAWAAWMASGGYKAPDDWQVSPMPWGLPEAKAQAVPEDYSPGKDTALAVGELIHALTAWKATTPATAAPAWEKLVQACRWMVEATAPQPPAPSEQRKPESKLFVVLNSTRTEGFLTDSYGDARHAATGRRPLTFGYSTLAEAFRDCYGDEGRFEVCEIDAHGIRSTGGEHG